MVAPALVGRQATITEAMCRIAEVTSQQRTLARLWPMLCAKLIKVNKL